MHYWYENIIGIMTVIIGSISIIITLKAYKSINTSILSKYLRYIILAIFSLTLFSLWHTIREIMDLKEIHGAIIEIPEYIFIIIAYMSFIIASYAVYKISSLFEIKESGKIIEINIKKEKR